MEQNVLFCCVAFLGTRAEFPTPFGLPTNAAPFALRELLQRPGCCSFGRGAHHTEKFDISQNLFCLMKLEPNVSSVHTILSVNQFLTRGPGREVAG